MRCRHRLSKLLLRRGIRFDDGRAWTDRHRAWLAGVDLGHDAAQATLADAIGAVDVLCSVAISSSARSSRDWAIRPGPATSAGCAACAASTR